MAGELQEAIDNCAGGDVGRFGNGCPFRHVEVPIPGEDNGDRLRRQISLSPIMERERPRECGEEK